MQPLERYLVPIKAVERADPCPPRVRELHRPKPFPRVPRLDALCPDNYSSADFENRKWSRRAMLGIARPTRTA
jgi:hypothetical protein